MDSINELANVDGKWEKGISTTAPVEDPGMFPEQ